ncbi:MAG: phytase [Candidatus Roizmanbacteria bacterium]|nr:phytase [Candidatus Roizmanbacteria bacterium]
MLGALHFSNILSKKRFFLPAIFFLLSTVIIYFSSETNAQQASVQATVETTPVTNSKDAADDSAVWIHPTDSSLSTIIGTDKPGNLEVYDLSGAVLQRIPFRTNNVDIRYNFLLGGENVALVTGIDRDTHKLFVYKVNPDTRLLEDVSAPQPWFNGLLGSAMYVSPVTGKYYIFTNFESILKQYELSDNGSGQVAINLVRTVVYSTSGGMSEGVVADDVYGDVYVSEEAVAIWKLGAEPTDGEAKVMVDKPIVEGGHFEPDVEGLTIYYKSDGTGYLIASSQGNRTFVVYTREGNNDFLETFTIDDGIIDGVSGTDGIDVTNFPLGTAFPYGVFIAQDGRNKDGDVSLNQNFKLVPFESIAGALNLTMDTAWDPRLVGSGPLVTPTPTNTPTPTPTNDPMQPTPTPTETPTPTPTPSNETELLFSPTDDASLNSNTPNKNLGSETNLVARSGPERDFLVKFSVSGVSGRQVVNAVLRLYVKDTSDIGGNFYHLFDNNWSQDTVTWNSAPTTLGSLLISLDKVTKNNWYELDVTSLIAGDGTYSLRVKSPSTNAVGYASSEDTLLGPQLIVTVAE